MDNHTETVDGSDSECEVLDLQEENMESKSSLTQRKRGKARRRDRRGLLFQCSKFDCLAQFKQKRYLKLHSGLEHPEGKGLIHKWQHTICPECQQVTQCKAHLRIHLMIHYGIKEHECPEKDCKKQFFTKEKLDQHIRTHTEERPYKCEECGQQFKQISGLSRHMKLHEQPEEWSITCEFCEKKFYRKDNLKDHLKVHMEKGRHQAK